MQTPKASRTARKQQRQTPKANDAAEKQKLGTRTDGLIRQDEDDGKDIKEKAEWGVREKERRVPPVA